MSGIVASTNGRIARPIFVTAAVATTIASTTSGPVQPRTPNATSAAENAMTSLVVGFSRRYVPSTGRRT